VSNLRCGRVTSYSGTYNKDIDDDDNADDKVQDDEVNG
jgi:hypothetical protein